MQAEPAPAQDLQERLAHGARRYMGKTPDDLSPAEQAALSHAVERQVLSRNVGDENNIRQSFGTRTADAVARFGGSWPFIGIFAAFLAFWVLGNLLLRGEAFDPYPYIFLNLMLSMLAAVQAPIIMMSQNRQAERDRVAASHDYEINLKAEIEIMALHDKLDQMRNQELRDLIEKQQQQIDMLSRIILADKSS